jgi:heat-inducible transcriptional repressor
MSEELSDRQIKILKAIIEEYIASAEPVSSGEIERKFSLGVSPATIRTEMAKLMDEGYIRQPHTSSGRTPTIMGLKYYIDRLMEERQLGVTDEVSAKERVWDCRFDEDRLLRETVRFLAQKTRALALATTNEGDVYHSGYANILNSPEFYDIDVARQVLAFLDENQRIRDLFFGRSYEERPINILFGEELGLPYFDPVGMIYSPFHLGQKINGALVVIGPIRLNYPQVIPMVRYMSHLLDDLSQSW